MTRDEFKDAVSKIELMYRGKEFLPSKEVFDEWYLHFKGDEHDDLLEAARRHADKVEYIPQIANLKFYLREIEQERKYLGLLLDEEYRKGASMYPNGGSEDARKLFMDLCHQGRDFDNKIDRARYMSMKIYNFGKNATEYIPLEEFIKREFVK